MNIRVFIDTDVIISASLSTSGAAYQLLNNVHIQKFVSNFSIDDAQSTSKN